MRYTYNWRQRSGYIPGPGTQPPRLIGHPISLEDVKDFLKRYQEYVVHTLNVGQNTLRIRELVPRTLVEILKEDYGKGGNLRMTTFARHWVCS